jgi:hypothetical protein
VAAYPCSFGNHRYAGAQRSAYLSSVSTSRPVTVKWRLCPRHFEEQEQLAAQILSKLDEDAQMSMECEAQNCFNARDLTLFFKVFGEDGQEPRQYVADFCLAHGTAASNALKADLAMAL